MASLNYTSFGDIKAVPEKVQAFMDDIEFLQESLPCTQLLLNRIPDATTIEDVQGLTRELESCSKSINWWLQLAGKSVVESFKDAKFIFRRMKAAAEIDGFVEIHHRIASHRSAIQLCLTNITM